MKMYIFALAKTIIKNRYIRFTYFFNGHKNNGVVNFQIFKLRFLDCFRKQGMATPISSLNLKQFYV